MRLNSCSRPWFNALRGTSSASPSFLSLGQARLPQQLRPFQLMPYSGIEPPIMPCSQYLPSFSSLSMSSTSCSSLYSPSPSQSDESEFESSSNYDESDDESDSTDRPPSLPYACACCGGAALLWEERNKQPPGPGSRRPDLPTYTLEEVATHITNETGIWVIYKEGVYDVTDFIEEHPGGDQIMMAAGGSVEPFWMLYSFHNDYSILNKLEEYRIGNVSKEESQGCIEDMYDPYHNEPQRSPYLKPASVQPFNAEAPLSTLADNFITPNEYFYVRNHLPVPEIDPDNYILEVEVDGRNTKKTFTLGALKKMPKCTVTATIMCAGNRRSEMNETKPVQGLNWGAAALGTATWTGVRLRDILQSVGLDDDEEIIQHVSCEGIDVNATGNNYGGSIPYWKAMEKRGDVILAYEMNGVPIPRDHGYPVRVIVPGVVGARSVKWLGKVVASETESQSHWQQNDYKGFSPSVTWENVDFTTSPAIQELPVTSAICRPSANDTIVMDKNYVDVKGYAYSGGGRKIIRVDVTADGGKTWYPAKFDHQDSAEPPRHWTWTLWSIQIPIEQKLDGVEIWAKAVDSSYNTQPETFQNIWNLRGVLSNAYHRVPVKLKWP